MKRLVGGASALFALTSALLAGCGDDSGPSAGPAYPDALEGSIRVSAAASLRVAMEEVAEGFRVEHPDVEVVFNFDSSSTLAAQILAGAPADVFASADEEDMAELTDAGEVDGEPETIALNELVIVTEPGNPEGISGLADLSDVGIISMCGEDVPCGRYAQEALELSGVTVPESSVTRGQNAAATLTAVTEGDAVAAVVYATDAIGASEAVERVDLPLGSNVVASYPIAALAGSGDVELARAFVDHVLGPGGQTVLKEHGFLPPR